MADIFLFILIIGFGILLGRYFAMLRIQKTIAKFEKEHHLYLEGKAKVVRNFSHSGGGINELNQKRGEAKEVHLSQVMELVREKGDVRNDDVEKILEVSNTTAQRYLDELEEKGHLEQIGHIGRGVYYKEVK